MHARDLLWVFYLPTKQCVSSMSAHSLRVSLPIQTSEMGDTTFILSGLWLQHPDLNQMNYKICIKFQQRIFLRKIHNVNWPTLWYGWHGLSNASSITPQTSGVNVSESVCPCKRRTFLVFNLTANSTFVYFNMLVWWKLQLSWCYCAKYIRFSPFIIFWHFTR